MSQSEDKWVQVYTTPLAHRAEIVRSVLAEEGMNPVVIDKKDSSLKFGYYEVLVIRDEARAAANMIENGIKFDEE
ncbi:MAG TPA: hypothetical protein VI583_16935 [Cyclobacteriaceae bacterium]|nr:hypothetical protein [Cyclobacteriaceae bacterium]